MVGKKLGMEIFPKTVYTDIVDMPATMLLGLTIHYYNHSDVDLYMKIFVEGPSPWSSNAVALGILASGANAYINLDNFTSRTKPSSATTEVLTLTLRGYSDSGYSVLMYEFSRSVTVVFIKSDDGTWTQDVLNNFNDGTVQGWAGTGEAGNCTNVSFAVATDYVLSTPYSLKYVHTIVTGVTSPPKTYAGRARLYKSFTTPNRDTIYAIMNIRLGYLFEGNSGTNYVKYVEVRSGSTVLMHLGRLADTVLADYFPKEKWVRIIVPLPKTTTLELQIAHHQISYITGIATPNKCHEIIWLDDFKIISK